ncbi:ABC transporter substrate-binding protein [Mycolicibacterium mageritense]|uniref:ABC transporter substrate-binding protein n=1 Tax=Mycolicibacterium mageritense TaxID=53462 RepID=UPI001E391D54|nr:ABC transporter substrate-binding protein [Mycolicibacterium mageritense]GJJ21430.1 nitrate ABC transporter substrate-binding protein [Mycolicibacterium mageritense]
MKYDVPLLKRIAALVVAICTLAACGAPELRTQPRPDLMIGRVDLSTVCPATISVQTDWNPQAEQGGLYQLLGDPAAVHIDTSTATVTGPLFAEGGYTGVDLQIRAGGPAIGQQAVSAQMYTDPTITLGYVNTDEAVRLSATMPTTAVFAPLDKSPQIIMWDPASWPAVHRIADLGDAGAVVRYFGGTTYMEYLVSTGQLHADQVDAGYDGTPGNWVAAGGRDAQQGYAGVEPYVYQHELDSWGKPVSYQLIHDTGYPIYQNAISVRSAELPTLAPCLRRLVPIMQHAAIDYLNEPEHANALILEAVDTFNNGWLYTTGVAGHSDRVMRELGLVGNGDNTTLGDFDMNRIQRTVAITEPIFTATGSPPRPGLLPADLATNEFIDPTIGMDNR